MLGMKLPSKIVFAGDEQCAEMKLPKEAFADNMQEGCAAFDAWALALIPKAVRVKINCEEGQNLDLTNLTKQQLPHYQRALYRLRRFNDLMGDRVIISPAELFSRSKILSCSRPILTVVDKDKKKESRSGTEAHIEKEFKRNGSPSRKRLMNAFGLKKLDRQFPVSLYNGDPPRKGMELCATGKIDLIGLDRNHGLWLFELKKPGNKEVGALSELLFYAAVLRDTLGENPSFHFTRKEPGPRAEVFPDDVCDANYIHARLLSPKTHRFLTDDVFELLNKAADGAGWPIDYGRIDLKPYCLLDQN